MSNKISIKNSKAKFEYTFIDTYVAGIQLTGTEIKSIRNNKASIVEAYCVVQKGEIFIRNMYIQEYENRGFVNHEARRDRKLLLNATEINKIERKIKTKGFALVPYKLFMTDKGWAKLEISLAQGKKLYDKREDLKDKDAKREIDRVAKMTR
jgi:SsrA-binding protein